LAQVVWGQESGRVEMEQEWEQVALDQILS
jgi:hypothetical protein